MAKARVLIVDDNEKNRDHLIELLRFDDVEVVGESTYGAAAYTWAQQLDIDVVIVAIEEPVARALRTVEALSSGAQSWPVVAISSRGDRDTMRKAMISGVRDFLVQPVNAEELRQTVVNVRHVDQARKASSSETGLSHALGTVIAIAGFKGGIGKSAVSSNIAVALAQQTQQHVALIDLDLQFGDAAVMLDVIPNATIEDAAAEIERIDPQLFQSYLQTHPSRLRVLAAPYKPDAADHITDESVERILSMAAATNDFVVIDTAPHLDGLSMAAMEIATIVLVVVIPELPCLRRTKAALTLMQSWGYSKDKVKLVVNRAQRRGAVSTAEIERVLDYPVYAEIPDDRHILTGITVGTPASMSAPKSKAGRALNDLARTLCGVPRPQERLGLFNRTPKRTAPSARKAEPQAQVFASEPLWRAEISDELPSINGVAPLQPLAVPETGIRIGLESNPSDLGGSHIAQLLSNGYGRQDAEPVPAQSGSGNYARWTVPAERKD